MRSQTLSSEGTQTPPLHHVWPGAAALVQHGQVRQICRSASVFRQHQFFFWFLGFFFFCLYVLVFPPRLSSEGTQTPRSIMSGLERRPSSSTVKFAGQLPMLISSVSITDSTWRELLGGILYHRPLSP